jgi:peptidoglycan/LPS O-acetylase OafA/YrhL
MWTRARGAWHPWRVKEALESRSAEAVGPVAWLVRRLTRVTSGGPYIPALDGLRWLAMALVFLQHFQLAIVSTTLDRSVSPDPGLRTLYDLRVGVELFFVISGFILGVPFVNERVLGKERVELRAYFLRRLTRIEPPYAIALALFTVGWLLVGREPELTLRHALASLFYVHNLVYGAFHPQAINMVTWSLEIEVQFYVLAPVLARVFLVPSARARRLALVGAIVLSAVLVELARRAGNEPPLSILTQIPYFAAGFLLADLYVVDWSAAPSTSWRWDLVAILAWCALPAIATAPIPLKDLAIATTLFVAFVGSFRSVATRAFLGWTPVRLLGGMCYSIYLLHYIPTMFGWRLVVATDLLGASSAHGARWLDTLAYGALMFVLLFPAFLAYYLAVEHPFMSNRWWKRGGVPVPAAR